MRVLDLTSVDAFDFRALRLTQRKAYDDKVKALALKSEGQASPTKRKASANNNGSDGKRGRHSKANGGAGGQNGSFSRPKQPKSAYVERGQAPMTLIGL